MKRSVQSRRTAAQMQGLTSVRRDIRSQDQLSDSKYLREFAESFTKYDAVLAEEQVFQKISSASLILIGDYHALPASQHFAADLIEKVARERPVVLAVEAVLARDQQVLDAWWRREIDSEQLRLRLRLDREWGYQWEPLYKLMSSARDCADGLYGLDCMPRGDLRRIRSRDRHAAQKLREIRERHPNAAMLVLFGESHLAPQHLPAELRKLMPCENALLVLQNLDQLYWQVVTEKASAVSLGENAICVFNSSPLEKYESYRLCLERWKAADELQDFAPAIYNLIFSLARSLGFRLDSPRNGTQPKFLADSLPEVIAVDESRASELGLDERPCRYFPGSNQFMVNQFHIADAARECTRFLQFACRGMAESCATSKFVEEALAQFGSRLLSPEQTTGAAEPALGNEIYEAYVANKISKLELRKIFLSHLGTREESARALEILHDLARR